MNDCADPRNARVCTFFLRVADATLQRRGSSLVAAPRSCTPPFDSTYPEGINSSDLPEAVRIISAADALDATTLTEARFAVYKTHVTRGERIRRQLRNYVKTALPSNAARQFFVRILDQGYIFSRRTQNTKYAPARCRPECSRGESAPRAASYKSRTPSKA